MTHHPTDTATGQSRISLLEPHEARDWARRLGCSEGELREAVAAIGDNPAEVEEWLKER